MRRVTCFNSLFLRTNWCHAATGVQSIDNAMTMRGVTGRSTGRCAHSARCDAAKLRHIYTSQLTVMWCTFSLRCNCFGISVHKCDAVHTCHNSIASRQVPQSGQRLSSLTRPGSPSSSLSSTVNVTPSFHPRNGTPHASRRRRDVLFKTCAFLILLRPSFVQAQKRIILVNSLPKPARWS